MGRSVWGATQTNKQKTHKHFSDGPCGAIVPTLSFFSLVFSKIPRKTSKTPRNFLTLQALKTPGKWAENTPKDQGNPQQEKHQGNKNTKEKKDRECLETIFDLQLASPKLSPKMPPGLSLAHKRGLHFLFQNYPCGKDTCETIERWELSHGNFCSVTLRCLFWPTRQDKNR